MHEGILPGKQRARERPAARVQSRLMNALEELHARCRGFLDSAGLEQFEDVRDPVMCPPQSCHLAEARSDFLGHHGVAER